MIAEGVFACFNMCQQNAQELRDQKKRLDEELLKLERRQKKIMTRIDLPHSPVREPWDYPTPPRVYNPWEDFVPPQNPHDDDDIELDYGGQEITGCDDEEHEAGGDDNATESDGDDDGDNDE